MTTRQRSAYCSSCTLTATDYAGAGPRGECAGKTPGGLGRRVSRGTSGKLGEIGGNWCHGNWCQFIFLHMEIGVSSFFCTLQLQKNELTPISANFRTPISDTSRDEIRGRALRPHPEQPAVHPARRH